MLRYFPYTSLSFRTLINKQTGIAFCRKQGKPVAIFCSSLKIGIFYQILTCFFVSYFHEIAIDKNWYF